jgi:hypothetical protein
MLNLWIDDERKGPESWMVAKTALEAIKLLRQHNFECISFDHDLGEGGTGYDVLLYIEKMAFTDINYLCPKLLIHSANPVGRQRMKQAIESIEKITSRY